MPQHSSKSYDKRVSARITVRGFIVTERNKDGSVFARADSKGQFPVYERAKDATEFALSSMEEVRHVTLSIGKIAGEGKGRARE